METFSKENGVMEGKTEEEVIDLVMEINMRDMFRVIRGMEKEFINGIITAA